MKKMRQYIVLATAAALLTACSNDADETTGGYVPSDEAIAFDVADDSQTRAPGEIVENDANDLVAAGGFGVFACYTGKLTYENTTVSPDFMYNQHVTGTKSGEDIIWSYSPVKYWPNSATDRVSFFAYAPYEANPKDDGTKCIIDMSKSNDLGDPWINYRIATDPWSTTNPQVDLLFGTKKGDGDTYTHWLDQLREDYDINSKLTFSFRHALACIGDEITICLSSDLAALIAGYADINITHLQIDYKNLTAKGHLVLYKIGGTANWKEIISGEITTTRTYHKDVNITFDKGATDNTDAKDLSEGDGLFYIPIQVKGADAACAEVTITYTVTNNAGSSYSGTSSTTFPLDINLGEGNKQGIALRLSKNLDLQHLVYEIGTGATESSFSRQR